LQSVQERDQLATQLEQLRKQAQQAEESNNLASDRNMLLDLELQRLEEYSTQLQQNVDSTIDTYNSQFTNLCELITENNKELQDLRAQGAESESSFFKMAVQNDILEARVAGLNFEQEMRLAQDAEHKLHMLKSDTADAKQRSKTLAESCALSIQKWQTRVTEMQEQIRRAH
jgi:chromosome segregation ATPase